MSQGMRWKLIVGCLVLAALEAPGSAVVFVEDLEGPWKGDEASKNVLVSKGNRGSVEDPLLKARSVEASVDLEELLDRARRDPIEPRPRPVAVLVAR